MTELPEEPSQDKALTDAVDDVEAPEEEEQQ